MVSAKQLEGGYSFVKANSGNEPLKCHIVPTKGTKVVLYQLTASLARGLAACDGLSINEEAKQSLLGALLLAQWEDCSWNGQFDYDVTSCETKVICGGKKFFAQLNEKWNSNSSTPIENQVIQPLGPSTRKNVKIHTEDILLCIARGENESSVLMSSAMVPQDGTLVIINPNPIEYGHVYLVPYDFCHQVKMLDKRSLEYITQIAVEVADCSFRVFYEHVPLANPVAACFQANFFENALPVELLELAPVYGNVLDKGVHICEVTGYPLKTLTFTSNENLKLLITVVMEICSVLEERNAVFSLLITDCGRKIFLFPQAQSSSTVHLSAWECAGYFVFKKALEFDNTSEDEISKILASVSLDDGAFLALKQLCGSISNKLVS
ncbi:GDP-L-galactose phosphorylase 1-like isoform X1 [Dioscorea cayenensis subsp. rotundata]|uniref:GDP-L-galactose phosphorylase 1-like isoform X1 n=1 Tax=Dioscorea cayennensis subsp. rotundata TaxID=55577 RepID=A0AB40AKE6_DIOCR|nr:GDP-L-galactose phosphorylase 1-like isoform X1 [Dioscorea cayenensis subsp. rotundata]XP_039115476.1 GDP-L-galactose phosphorylase 1-like isoform X1 [Dioscorea cayenensis subsp. rotundata]